MRLPKPTPAHELTGPQLAERLTQLGYTLRDRLSRYDWDTLADTLHSSSVSLDELHDPKRVWALGSDNPAELEAEISRLRAELGYSPVYLRYNTGRHISDNGREFSDLLDRLVRSWPVPEASGSPCRPMPRCSPARSATGSSMWPA